MEIPIEQVWEYEIKATDTLRVLEAFESAWRVLGCEIEIMNRGGRMFAVRREKESPIEKHYRLLNNYYKEKYENHS